MYHDQNVHLCNWCDRRLTANPFTTTIGDEVLLFCSEAHRNDHYQYLAQVRAAQSRFNFDVVV